MPAVGLERPDWHSLLTRRDGGVTNAAVGEPPLAPAGLRGRRRGAAGWPGGASAATSHAQSSSRYTAAVSAATRAHEN